MTTLDSGITAAFWRTRRSAAIAGIVFALLLLTAVALIRYGIGSADPSAIETDPQRQDLVRLGLHIVPFAGIAFLWFIGVVRDQLGEVEDRLFSTVFLGSGVLFVGLLFQGAVTTSSLITMVARQEPDVGLWLFGRDSAQTLISVYALRMAAVFVLSVSTVGIRTAAVPRWIAYLGYATALVLLVAAGEHKWVQLIFPVWVLLLSVVILLTRPRVPTR